MDVEAAGEVDFAGQAEDEVDVEYQSDAEAGKAEAEGRVGGEEVDGVDGAGRDVYGYVDVGFYPGEVEADAGVDEVFF